MPITTKHGSMLDKSRAQVLVCPVNCVGVMGKGLAKEFKRRFPEMFVEYSNICAQPLHNTRSVLCPGDTVYLQEWRTILAFTKNDWRNPSEIEWIEDCLQRISMIARRLNSSIAIPQLGCGCGGLDWAEVWPLYEKHLGGLDCDVEVWIWP